MVARAYTNERSYAIVTVMVSSSLWPALSLADGKLPIGACSADRRQRWGLENKGPVPEQGRANADVQLA
ncbi:hypothetical protein CEXT_627311 [Caerostris extrusa]|uniref:Uncharacterized protein n=1 Tax=Caerostris extrusa TaxID=172846 RepID=A0AAV4U2P6_CAEEX|nr:hypothetical protein CEXT_627311 [Caerostris extrusa]